MMLAMDDIQYSELETRSTLLLHHVESARVLAATSGKHLLDVLEDVSGLSSDAFVSALGELLHYPTVDIVQLHQMTPDFEKLPFQQASRLECLLVRNLQSQLCLVCANPFDPFLPGKIELLLDGKPAIWMIAHRNDLAAFLGKYEESMRAMDGLLPDQSATGAETHGIEDISLKTISEDTSPVVKLVRSTLYDALKAGASDIHMETDPNGLTIKYRIDGVLNTVASVQSALQAEQAISRIKVMSELDIAERRIPQDGRFKVLVQGREVDLRVSIMPSVFGEDAVLRILDRKAVTDQAKGLSMEVLGFEESIMARFRLLAEEPYGMLLVTGPTGSGKTTTLYGIISEINNGQDKIVTIEDPVEYQLPGVLQIPVNEKKGLTFARGLRSILRHDPDKIMVGEIRDSET
ncbi:MAG: GspE/PulE family protein, partial [Methylophilaceae bacterium]